MKVNYLMKIVWAIQKPVGSNSKDFNRKQNPNHEKQYQNFESLNLKIKII